MGESAALSCTTAPYSYLQYLPTGFQSRFQWIPAYQHVECLKKVFFDYSSRWFCRSVLVCMSSVCLFQHRERDRDKVVQCVRRFHYHLEENKGYCRLMWQNSGYTPYSALWYGTASLSVTVNIIMLYTPPAACLHWLVVWLFKKKKKKGPMGGEEESDWAL